MVKKNIVTKQNNEYVKINAKMFSIIMSQKIIRIVYIYHLKDVY